MKYTAAWANVSAQNVSLKVALIALSGVSISLAIATARLAFRTPLVIERPLDSAVGVRAGMTMNPLCLSRSVDAATSPTRSTTEVESFVWEAIHERFDSDSTLRSTYLAPSEEGSREAEQKELSSRNMTQTIIVRHIKASATGTSEVNVDSDRLISVGQVRSAFPFPLTVTVGNVARTEANPYGLQLTQITQVTGGAGK